MEKQLILFRHGKSDWDAVFETDRQRPLSKRGMKASKVMGRLLADAAQVPDLAITSSAIRANSTVELAAEAGEWHCPVQIADALYDADPAKVLAVILQVPDTVETLLLVGHEPVWSELTSLLIGGGKIRFPTAAMARVDFELDSWQQVGYGKGRLVWLLQPKFFT